MLGKIIRVGGVFKANGLPKLEDHDASDLMNAILSNDAVIAFYDFIDESMIEFNGDKVVKIKDKKSGHQFVQTNLALAPKYNRAIFNGVGGLYFDGTAEMSVDEFYTGSITGSVSAFLFPTALQTDNCMILSLKNFDRFSIYINKAASEIRAFSGEARVKPVDISGHNHLKLGWDNYAVNISANEATGKEGVYQGFPPKSGVNIGRWDSGSAPSYFSGYMGHIILLKNDIFRNEYLNQLISEYCKRRYKHYV